MADSRVRVGFIGAGRISDLHAIEYRRNPRAQLLAVCDLDVQIARRQAARWGVPEDRVFSDYHELLACGDIDLVEILLPHHLHAPVALAAIRAGKHVSVQKPMTLSVRDADEVIDAARAAKLQLHVFENALFYPPVQRAKALIDAGAIGEPLSIRVKCNKGDPSTAWAVPESARAWRQDAVKSGGGPLTFDDGHHKFAIAWHFMGKPEQVHAWIERREIEPGVVLDAPAMISWKFAGGRYGNLEVVYSPKLRVMTEHYAQHDPIEITGSKGVIWITRGHGRLFDQPPVVLYADGEVRGFSDMAGGWESSFIEATRHHIDTLLDGGTPVLTGEQGREILRFCLAAQRSAREGRAVRVEEEQ
ncbi:MAG TPA: Gfo/Idh/MocA family oxidoreductase [Burkholderiales bacterium]|nr:Gfo/Idh/MocA family oxidoreductase [Burkholderiales bacterium]